MALPFVGGGARPLIDGEGYKLYLLEDLGISQPKLQCLPGGGAARGYTELKKASQQLKFMRMLIAAGS